MQDPQEYEGSNQPIEKLYGLFPKLDRKERRDLVKRISIGAEGGIDFMVMMCLTATLGLLQGSTAVVIGLTNDQSFIAMNGGLLLVTNIEVIEKRRTGAIRPPSYPVTPQVRKVVDAFIDPLIGVELLSMSRLSIEPESGITVIVATTRTSPRTSGKS